MESHRQNELIRRYLDAYNALDIDRMCSLLSNEVVFENHSGAVVTANTSGLEEFRRLAEQSKAIFSEREQSIKWIESIDNDATVGIAFKGRLAVDFPNGPSAGTALDLTGTSQFSFEHGKITKIIDRS